MSFLTTIIDKRKNKKIDVELHNVEMCMLDWCHGDMGYQQTKEEIEELENKKHELEKAKNKLISGRNILVNVRIQYLIATLAAVGLMLILNIIFNRVW